MPPTPKFSSLTDTRIRNKYQPRMYEINGGESYIYLVSSLPYLWSSVYADYDISPESLICTMKLDLARRNVVK